MKDMVEVRRVTRQVELIERLVELQGCQGVVLEINERFNHVIFRKEGDVFGTSFPIETFMEIMQSNLPTILAMAIKSLKEESLKHIPEALDELSTTKSEVVTIRDQYQSEVKK